MNSDTLRRLAAIDMPAEALREVLSVMADVQAADEQRKAKDRDRKKRVRGHSAEIPETVRGKDMEIPSETLPEVSPKDNIKTPSLPSQPSLRSDLDRARETFDRFFAIFPKRINRKDALTRWKTAMKAGIDPEKIIAAAVRYADHTKFTEPQFIKAPDAWLNAGKYDDELPAEAPKPQSRGSPRSAGDGMAVVTRKLQEKRNGQQSPDQPRDITPASPEPGTGDLGSHLHEPAGKSSGGGEILNFRSTSPDLRRSATFGSEAARTFEWSGTD